MNIAKFVSPKSAVALLKKGQAVLSKHSGSIATGAAIAGVVVTTGLAIRATVKATKKIEVADANGEVESPADVAKLVWKDYAPVALSAGSTVMCVLAAHHIDSKKIAAVSAAYNLAQQALEEQIAATKDVVGEGKASKIRERVAEKKLEDHPASKSEVIVTGNGDALCYESLSGRYFMSDIEKVRQAVNDYNYELIRCDSLSVNEWFDHLLLGHTKDGEILGWTSNTLLECEFRSKLTDDNKPCLVIDYANDPTPRYRDLY